MCWRFSLLRVGRLCAVFAVSVLLVTACGGDSGSDSDRADSATTEATTDDTSMDDSTDTSADDVDESDDDQSDDSAEPADGVDRSGELVGRWDIVNYALNDGGLTNVVGDGAQITYADDGTLTYDTGCNDGSSTYETSGVYVVPDSPLDDTPEGQEITMGPDFEQTAIGCEGFLGDQDADLPARFGEATRFVIDGDTLSLLDEFLLVEATRAS